LPSPRPEFTGSVTRAEGSLFIPAVVGLSFLLLIIAFRSLVIPLTAAVMNLLAAARIVRSGSCDLPMGRGLDTLNIGKDGPIDE
jgi:RND superfamily putative drug exporter